MALPDTYKQVEYLQSDGNQIIDTGIYGNGNTSILTKMVVTGRKGNYDMYYGAYGDGGVSAFFIQSNYPDDNKLRVVNNSNDASLRKYVDSINNLQFNTEYTIEHTNTNFSINGTLQGTMASSSFTTNYTLCVFGIHGKTGALTPKLIGKVYYFKIYNSSTLVRDFVPVLRKSDNKPGLYDLVNDVFYTNAGTGEFTYKEYAESGKITHIYLGTNLIRPKLSKSFYYDFTNSSVAAIGQDWQITNPGNIVYDTNKGLGRTSSSEYSLNMYNCINMSNVTKKVTFKIGVVTRASSGGVYGGTISVNNGTSSLWIHDNSQNYMTGDINGRYESNYWYRNAGYNVSGYDIVEWDFENLTMKCTVVGDGQRTVNIQSGQLNTIKTFTNVYLGGSTMWWKDLLIEWE